MLFIAVFVSKIALYIIIKVCIRSIYKFIYFIVSFLKLLNMKLKLIKTRDKVIFVYSAGCWVIY
jgi:hypothetical protein